MTIERPEFPQFFITEEANCPYIDGRMERKVFTHLVGNDAVKLHDVLANGGFRRSQNIAYRPSCEDCHACVSVRIPVDKFIWKKSFLRVLKRNKHLSSHIMPAVTTPEQFSLFSDYVASRHGDGGMADMTVLDFSAMVEESAVNTNLIEYRHQPQISLANPQTQKGRQQGPLTAVALTDRLADGLSMIYSFFDIELASQSLGTFMILDHIQKTQKMGLPYLYLGYWINGSQKMSYKANFLPQERLGENGWVLVED